MDWKMRREEVEKLIAAYRKLKCLWDFRCNEYKIYEFKKKGWLKLGRLFGKEPNIVKKKIKCLRAVYRNERRKVEDSYGSDKIYRPNLFYYKSLNFLDSVIVNKNGEQFKTIDCIPDFIPSDNEEHLNSCGQHYTEIEEFDSPLPSPSSPLVESGIDYESNAILQQKHRLAPRLSNLGSSLNIRDETKSSPEQSLYKAFGKTIALQLSQLPPLDATTTMSQIHQVLSKNIVKSLLSKEKHFQ